jgi:hypothetical protein
MAATPSPPRCARWTSRLTRPPRSCPTRGWRWCRSWRSIGPRSPGGRWSCKVSRLWRPSVCQACCAPFRRYSGPSGWPPWPTRRGSASTPAPNLQRLHGPQAEEGRVFGVSLADGSTAGELFCLIMPLGESSGRTFGPAFGRPHVCPGCHAGWYGLPQPRGRDRAAPGDAGGRAGHGPDPGGWTSSPPSCDGTPMGWSALTRARTDHASRQHPDPGCPDS